MNHRANKRIYGVTGHPMMEALPLIIAFAAGLVGILIFKIMPAGHGAMTLIGAAYSAAVLVCYAAIAYLATPLRMDAETIGDNCYYLGFLFTLISLAITLYFVALAPSTSRAEMIPEIISGFGAALSSTIFGVFLRVLMMQFKVDMESRERRERQSLNEASRHFRTELALSVQQMKKFTVESAQHIAERDEKVRVAYDQILADMQTQLLKSAETFGPALHDSVKQQTEAALKSVSEAVSSASDLSKSAVASTMTDLTSVAARAGQTNVEAVADLRKAVAELAEQAQRTLEVLGENQQALRKAAADFTAGLSAESTTLRNGLRTAGADISQSMLALGTDLSGQVDAVTQEVTQTVTASLQSTGQGLAKSLEALAAATEQAAMKVSQGGTRIGETLDTSAREISTASVSWTERAFSSLSVVEEMSSRLAAIGAISMPDADRLKGVASSSAA